MPREPSTTFTDKELEIMRAIWEMGEATARQIQERLPDERHYNSVLTIIRVLERKRHLAHRVEGRTHIYRARVSPEKAQSGVLNHIVEQVFGGSARSLVLNLVETGDLTKQDIDAIRRQIAASRKKGEGQQ